MNDENITSNNHDSTTIDEDISSVNISVNIGYYLTFSGKNGSMLKL